MLFVFLVFSESAVGEVAVFAHLAQTAVSQFDQVFPGNPVTGENHTMTILSQTRESLNHNYMSNDPCCYTRLNFTVDPPINRELLSVVDCDEAEGAVNLNALRSSGKLSGAGHNGVSSLRYTPAEQITWRMIFKLKTRPDMSIPLLP